MPQSGGTNRVRVFVSYAWEDEAYRELVKRLAARLREDGIDARLDAWHLEGLSIPEFMAREVRNADRMLVLCSPGYRRKVHAMEDGEQVTGVGWEHLLLTSALWSNNKDRKQLDVVLFSGIWSESVPSFLSGMPYIDLTNESTFEAQYRKLLQRLHGRTETAPEVRQAPADLDPLPVQPLRRRNVQPANYKTPPDLRIDLSAPYSAQFDTSRGRFGFSLHAREVPRLVNNFVFLALERFYDDTVFHRVVSNFVVQGGDPVGTGEGGPGYFLPDDFQGGPHVAGVLSMSNAGPNTNGSQFFITLANAPWLDSLYSRFGILESGWDNIRAIVHGDILRSVRIFEGRSEVRSWSDIVRHWEIVQEEARKRVKEAKEGSK